MPFQSHISGLDFPDPAQERRYQAARVEWLGHKFPPIVALIAALFLAFIPFDMTFAARHTAPLALARVTIAAMLFAVACLVRIRPAWVTTAAVVVAMLTYGGVFWARLITGPDTDYQLVTDVTLIQIGVWFLGVLTFLPAAIVNLAGTIGFVIVQLSIGAPEREVWVGCLYLSVLLLLGGYAAWHIERLFRRNFADQEELDAQRSEYRSRAMRDGLTGLWNRQAMLELLAANGKLSGVTGVGIAVLVVDLDRFKPVNDRFGHQAGDDVLVSVARRIQGELRAGDSAGRMGGDEFLIVAGNVPDESAARELGERIRRGIELPMRVRLHDESAYVEVSVGASVGVARFTGDAVEPDAIVNAADQDMYQDKLRRRAEGGESR